MYLFGLLCSSLLLSSASTRVTLKKIAAGLIAASASSFTPLAAYASLTPAPWDSNVMYEVLEKGKDGASAAKVGDLVAIRFKGNYKTLVFDDTFKTEEPYFYRAGVGLIAKGVDDAVVHMKVGDKLHLEFGGDLGFGLKGRPQSPGVPRIPPNAPLSFDVLLEDLPGTGEDFIADYDAPASDNDD